VQNNGEQTTEGTEGFLGSDRKPNFRDKEANGLFSGFTFCVIQSICSVNCGKVVVASVELNGICTPSTGYRSSPKQTKSDPMKNKLRLWIKWENEFD
jgi:hypothetical protein